MTIKQAPSGACLVFVLFALLFPACSGWDETAPLDELTAKTTPTGIKILLVGIDGATFRIIDPMLAEGKLPEIERLINGGTRAILKSVRPTISPALWTSMVTGRKRNDHGITGFVTGQGGRTSTPWKSPPGKLISSHDRRTAALWNILTAFDMTSGIIGWWVTWPAEKIKGYMVSDRAARTRWGEWTGGKVVARRTYPEALMEELEPMIFDPDNPPIHEFEKMLQWTHAEKVEFLDVKKPIFSHGLSVFKFAHCAQRSFEEIAVHMLETRPQPDLMTVFLIGQDPVCHTFWHYYEPGRFRGVNRRKAERFGQLIPNYYQHNDRYLTRLLSKVDKDTVVFIVSDHGFQPSGQLPEVRRREEFEDLRESADIIDRVTVGQSGWHHPAGIFIARGGPIKKGLALPVKAHIHDVTPTILALLGLPVARNMPGRVLTEVVEEEFWKKHPVRYIDSYERIVQRESLDSIERVQDPMLMDQLKALGYIVHEKK